MYVLSVLLPTAEQQKKNITFAAVGSYVRACRILRSPASHLTFDGFTSKNIKRFFSIAEANFTIAKSNKNTIAASRYLP